jgi:hypothetical protein
MLIWKKINCEFDNYEISNYCEVRNVKTGRILKSYIDKYGYIYHGLSGYGKTKKFKLHRLMALTFIPNPDNKKEVNHIDGNPKNNFMYNLEWVSHFENQSHKVKSWNRSSKYLGVTYNKREKKWKAQIQINKKKYSLGSYNLEYEAYQARVNFEKEKNIINKYI